MAVLQYINYGFTSCKRVTVYSGISEILVSLYTQTSDNWIFVNTATTILFLSQQLPTLREAMLLGKGLLAVFRAVASLSTHWTRHHYRARIQLGSR